MCGEMTDLETDPLIQPFFLDAIAYQEQIRSRVALLSDDDLLTVIDLFQYANYRNVPHEFWLHAAKVRAACNVELRRRQAASPSSEAVPA